MSADYSMKKGDLHPLTVVLRDGARVAVPLDTATSLKFFMRPTNSATNKVNGGAVTVVGAAADGKVKQTWVAGDVDTAGTYVAEWQITFVGSVVRTFPEDGYFIIEVVPDLGS